MSHREDQAKYERTAKGIATRKRYRTSPKGKARTLAAARRAYIRNREKKLARMKAYDAKRDRQAYDKTRSQRGKEITFWVNQAREAV